MNKHQVGQHFFVGFQGKTFSGFFADLVQEWLPGGIILFTRNIGDKNELADLLASIKEAYQRKDAPLPFIGIDQEGGRVARLKSPYPQFPSAEELVKAKDEKAFEENYREIFELLRSFGFNLDFLPVLDVLTNDENKVIGDRSYGTTPEEVVKFGSKVVTIARESGIIHCGKHFPGHGMTFADSHKELPSSDISEKELWETHINPYYDLCRTGQLDMIMTAHVLFPKIDDKPATFSPYFIREILREKLQYKNIVVTDDLEMNAIPLFMQEHHLGQSNSDNFMGDAVSISFEAGNDMALICNTDKLIFEGLCTTYDRRKQLAKCFEESLPRILSVKQRYL